MSNPIWTWKKRAESLFGKKNVKVFIKDNKQRAATRVSKDLHWDIWQLWKMGGIE